MPQTSTLPNQQDLYQESLLNVVYAAELVDVVVAGGFESRDSLESLHRALDAWKEAREAWLAPVLRSLRRDLSVRPVDEVIGL